MLSGAKHLYHCSGVLLIVVETLRSLTLPQGDMQSEKEVTWNNSTIREQTGTPSCLFASPRS